MSKEIQNEQEITRRYEIAVRNISRGWDNPQYLRNDRFEDLQAVSNYKSMKEGIKAPDVKQGEQISQGTRGYHINGKNESFISPRGMENPYQAVETLAHENQHCRQEQAEIDGKVRAQFTEEQMKGFEQPYVSPQKDYNAYYNHPKEQDARNAASVFRQQFENDVNAIKYSDQHLHFKGNQILETYDYKAMEYASQHNTAYSPDAFLSSRMDISTAQPTNQILQTTNDVSSVSGVNYESGTSAGICQISETSIVTEETTELSEGATYEGDVTCDMDVGADEDEGVEI